MFVRIFTRRFLWLFFIIFLYTLDRKSTRLNSSHDQISYAVFCLKKKNFFFFFFFFFFFLFFFFFFFFFFFLFFFFFFSFFFFFNDTATTEIYTLSLHDALPISTVEMMNSTDYKERFKAEYYQIKIRILLA